MADTGHFNALDTHRLTAYEVDNFKVKSDGSKFMNEFIFDGLFFTWTSF
jgi:hypothetical protein